MKFEEHLNGFSEAIENMDTKELKSRLLKYRDEWRDAVIRERIAHPELGPMELARRCEAPGASAVGGWLRSWRAAHRIFQITGELP